MRLTTSGDECVIYTRVSTKEQAENNGSLEWQKKHCEEFVRKKGLVIAGYYGGTYESAKTDERREFQHMLGQVLKSKGRISYIIVYSLDRFSRSGAEAIAIASDLRKQGIRVLSVTQPMDTTTSEGKFYQDLQLLFSQLDNDMRRSKTMAGTLAQLVKGNWVTRPPMGYEKVKVNGEIKIVVNKTGKLLGQAFEWKAQGLTSEAILTRLKAAGVTLYPQHLSRIFRNVFYCGYLSHQALGDGVVKGNQELLVSPELFKKVNGILASNHQHYQHQEGNENLPLKRFVKCGTCSTSFTGYIVQKKGLYYYKCNKNGCTCNSSAQGLHAAFLELLSGYQIDERLLPALTLQLQITFRQLNQSHPEQEQALRQGISELDKKLLRLEERYMDEEVTKDLFLKYQAKYQEEKLKLQQQLQKVDSSLSNLEVYIKSCS